MHTTQTVQILQSVAVFVPKMMYYCWSYHYSRRRKALAVTCVKLKGMCTLYKASHALYSRQGQPHVVRCWKHRQKKHGYFSLMHAHTTIHHILNTTHRAVTRKVHTSHERGRYPCQIDLRQSRADRRVPQIFQNKKIADLLVARGTPPSCRICFSKRPSILYCHETEAFTFPLTSLS